MSPSTKRNPAQLSRPTTVWSSFRSCSSRFEPMKPETPVTSQVFGEAWRVRVTLSIAEIMGVVRHLQNIPRRKF